MDETTAIASPAVNRFLACSSDFDVNGSSIMDMSTAYMNKKRKFQAEKKFRRHVDVGDQVPEFYSSEFCKKKVKSGVYEGEHESNPNCTEEGFRFGGDDFSCLPDGTEVRVLFPQSSASAGPSTVTFSSEITRQSLESQLLTKSCSSKSKTSSVCDEVDCHDYELPPTDTYEELIHEFGSCENCSCAECQIDGFEHCMGKELNSMLCPDEMTTSNNYVLSSGRWSVDQDTNQGTKELTIDKEFEQYFSMLML